MDPVACIRVEMQPENNDSNNNNCYSQQQHHRQEAQHPPQHVTFRVPLERVGTVPFRFDFEVPSWGSNLHVPTKEKGNGGGGDNNNDNNRQFSFELARSVRHRVQCVVSTYKKGSLLFPKDNDNENDLNPSTTAVNSLSNGGTVEYDAAAELLAGLGVVMVAGSDSPNDDSSTTTENDDDAALGLQPLGTATSFVDIHVPLDVAFGVIVPSARLMNITLSNIKSSNNNKRCWIVPSVDIFTSATKSCNANKRGSNDTYLVPNVLASEIFRPTFDDNHEKADSDSSASSHIVLREGEIYQLLVRLRLDIANMSSVSSLDVIPDEDAIMCTTVGLTLRRCKCLTGEKTEEEGKDDDKDNSSHTIMFDMPWPVWVALPDHF
eukprot:PhM_4_TR10606/c0_g1_i1/m.104856